MRVGEARYKETSGNWDDEANAYVPGTAGWKRRSVNWRSRQDLPTPELPIISTLKR